MVYIYTISHPFTNEIVYVGKTKDFEARKISHIISKNGTNISDYICYLRSIYLYPKIEILEEVEEEFCLEDEMYWIRQMKAWGFNLLNKNKIKAPKIGYYSGSKMSYISEGLRVKKSKTWTEEMMNIGEVYFLPCENRNSFYTVFRSYAKKYNLNRFLSFKKDCAQLIATVVDEKPPKKGGYVKKGFWPKYSEYRTRKISKTRELMLHLETVGNSIEIKCKNLVNLRNLVSMHLKHISKKRMKYEQLEDGLFKITRIK